MAYLLLILSVLTLPGMGISRAAAEKEFDQLKALLGPHDSIVVADPAGRILVSKNPDKKLVPASILKILTSLTAFHYLGTEYRYPTEFYLDRESNLKIKGFGDPLLTSEIVDQISRHLAAVLENPAGIRNLIIDESFFTRPLTIPGISSTSQPYDAPNGALCVNFNTVYFTRTPSGYISAEAQTPLLPFAENRIRALHLKSGRYVLSRVANENAIYAGKLFRYFLQRHGVHFSGTVMEGLVNPAEDRLIYRHVSPFPLSQVVEKLLRYSNNFTTNQLFISSGIQALGPPGNLAKGLMALQHYASNILGIENMSLVEGSGISRRNRISANEMLIILEKFKPHHQLMRKKDCEYYKTGTLIDIRTRAGYIDAGDHRLYSYVVMINTPGRSTTPIMHKLLRILEKHTD